MKVLHVPYTYPPSVGGGTEVYVEQLCRHLLTRGVRSVVAAPGPDDRAAVVNDIPVRWFAADPRTQTLATLYGAGDAAAADRFEQILADEQPDVVHQHALSPACSVELARRSVRAGVPVVFTVHTPAVFCQQGAMMRGNREPCGVAWEHAACTSCVLTAGGVPASVSTTMGWMPERLGAVAARRGWHGGVWTAVRMPALMKDRLRAVDEILGLATRLVAPARWVTDVLVRNGLPAGHIVEVPHGIAAPPPARRQSRSAADTLRLIHLGRIDPSKGTLLLVDAIASRPALLVTLDVFGLDGDGASSEHLQAIRSVAAGDPRIRLNPAVPHEAVMGLLSTFDAVVVPSQSFETGPLVVLEAFAAGVPVLGSALGGIAEKVRDGVDGLLVSSFTEREAWGRMIARCATDRALLPRLASGIVPPRSMLQVADDMVAIYRDVVALPAGHR